MLISIDFMIYFLIFSSVLVSVEKIYQTLSSVFDHISKHPKVRQKYPAEHRNYVQLSSQCWKCDQTLSFVFDIFLIIAQFNKLTSVFHASVL